MIWLERLKHLFAGPDTKPAEDEQPAPPVYDGTTTTTLPNGRVARTDARGNFIGFE